MSRKCFFLPRRPYRSLYLWQEQWKEAGQLQVRDIEFIMGCKETEAGQSTIVWIESPLRAPVILSGDSIFVADELNKLGIKARAVYVPTPSTIIMEKIRKAIDESTGHRGMV